MESRLQEAGIEGSVTILLQLLGEDPLILDRYTTGFHTETPLHVTATLGHLEFVREILNRKPELAEEPDSQRSLPIHLAAAKGHLEVVKAFLVVNPNTCLARDRNGRNPLHIAAMKDRIEVAKELVQARPQAARVLADQGQTILHLCVKQNQLEALKVLVETVEEEYVIVNSTDHDGNTILHMAVADKQIETIRYLISKPKPEVNAVNAYGFTALDMLAQGPRDVNDMAIAELLHRVGAHKSKDLRTSRPEKDEGGNSNWDKAANDQQDWLEKKRSALMIVASLIATMAFQAGVNPPGGVWQDNFLGDAHFPAHTAGNSVMADNSPGYYGVFQAFNTIGFVTSLSIILLLISGLPIRRRFFIWILMVILWIAITAMAVAYSWSVFSLSPDERSTLYTAGLVLYTWIGLMGLLVLVHLIRLARRMIHKFIRCFRTRGGHYILGHEILRS